MPVTWTRHPRILLMALGAALLLSACESTPRTRSDYDPTADFSAYRTFGFASKQPGNQDGQYTSLITRHLETTSRAEMEKRGYVYSDNSPDLLLDFQLLTQDKVRVNTAGCLNRCEEGPVVVVYPEDVWYTYVDQEDIDEIIDEHLVNGRIVKRLRI